MTQAGSKGKRKRSEVANLKKALAKERDKTKEYWNHLQRLQADFENYRRLAEKKVGEARVKAVWDISSQLLEVADELELALAHKGNKKTVRGVELTLQRLKHILSEQGLQPIDALGESFNPYHHETVGSIETDEPEGTVVEVLRKGYLFQGKVLRPAMVKTAKQRQKERNKGKG